MRIFFPCFFRSFSADFSSIWFKLTTNWKLSAELLRKLSISSLFESSSQFLARFRHCNFMFLTKANSFFNFFIIKIVKFTKKYKFSKKKKKKINLLLTSFANLLKWVQERQGFLVFLFLDFLVSFNDRVSLFLLSLIVLVFLLG